jgi:hypothetical protein
MTMRFVRSILWALASVIALTALLQVVLTRSPYLFIPGQPGPSILELFLWPLLLWALMLEASGWRRTETFILVFGGMGSAAITLVFGMLQSPWAFVITLVSIGLVFIRLPRLPTGVAFGVTSGFLVAGAHLRGASQYFNQDTAWVVATAGLVATAVACFALFALAVYRPPTYVGGGTP